MRKTIFAACIITAATAFTSCDNSETYADQKEREEAAINNYIRENGVNVISEEQFHRQGDSTSVAKNEYVLFESSGVYMQILDKGCGSVMKSGDKRNIIVRFKDYNINQGVTTFNSLEYLEIEDEMYVTNTSGTFTALFTKTNGLMYYANSSSTSVPSGWLVPLTYVKIGRPATEEEGPAHVKLIIPHDKGTTQASGNVHAYHYELTYLRH